MFSVLSDPAIYEFENKPPTSEKWLAHRYERLESAVRPLAKRGGSIGLFVSLAVGFSLASPEQVADSACAPDELVMVKAAANAQNGD